MFIEPNIKNRKSGWIEVICGSMFSGKTEELIRRLKRAQFSNHAVAIFKPSLDKCYDEQDIISHDGVRIRSIAVQEAKDISQNVIDIDVIGIDEVQFFDMGIIEVVKELALLKTRVICAGLDLDFSGNYNSNSFLFNNNWLNYGDSTANANAGFDVFEGEFEIPSRIAIYNFSFHP